jgi:hypothetical protein
MDNIHAVWQTLLHTEWYQDGVSKFSARSLKHWACPKTPQWVPLPHNAGRTYNFVADYSNSYRGLLKNQPLPFIFLYFFPFFDYVFLIFLLATSFLLDIFVLMGCYAVLMGSYRRFGTTYRSVLYWSSSPRTAWPLKMELIFCPRTSVLKHQSTLRNIPEERKISFAPRWEPAITFPFYYSLQLERCAFVVVTGVAVKVVVVIIIIIIIIIIIAIISTSVENLKHISGSL